MSTADPQCPVVWLHQQRWHRSTHRSPPHHGPHSQQNAGVQYFLTSPVCQRLLQPTKPYVVTSMHHSVDHLITHGSVDQTTTGWSTSVRTPSLLQLIYGAGPSSADTERPYGPAGYAMMMMMTMMMSDNYNNSAVSKNIKNSANQ